MDKPDRSGLLDGKKAVMEYLQVGEAKLDNLVKEGMPVRIDGKRWLAHKENLEIWLRWYTRPRDWSLTNG